MLVTHSKDCLCEANVGIIFPSRRTKKIRFYSKVYGCLTLAGQK